MAIEQKIDKLAEGVSITSPEMDPQQPLAVEEVPAAEVVEQEEPVQVAGVASAIGRLLKKPKPREIIPQPEALPTPRKEGGQVVIPEAKPALVDEIADEAAKVKQQATEAANDLPGIPPKKNYVTGTVEEGLQFNLDKIESTDDVRALIEATNKVMGIKANRVTFKEIKFAAAEQGIDEKFLARLVDNKGKLLPDAIETYKALNALTASAQELDRLFKLVGTGAASDIDKLKLRQQVAFHGLLQKGVKRVQTETARALAVFRIPREGNVDQVRQVLDEFGGDGSLNDLARAYMNLPTAAARNELIEKSMMSSVKDVWITTYINGLLSSPVTHAKNIFGNGGFTAMQMPERVIAGLIGSGRRALGANPEETAYVGEFMAQLAGVVRGSQEGLYLASRAFAKNAPSDQFSKIEGIRGQAANPISGEALGLDGFLGRGMDYYGSAVTVPGRALMAEDEFFKAVAYRMELNALAYRRGSAAYDNAIRAGRAPADADAIRLTEIDNILNFPPQELDAAAMDMARLVTFTRPLQEGSVGRAVQNLTSANLVAKVVLPFVRTPWNIALETIKRTPFAPLMGSVRSEIAAGGVARDLAVAKMGAGTMVMTSMFAWAAEGRITGSGPGDKGLRQNLERSGWQPYSFVFPRADLNAADIKYLNRLGQVSIGDDKVYVSYQGIEPIGGLIAMASDVVEYARWEDDPDAVSEVVLGSLYGLFQYMGEQPYLQGAAAVAGAFGQAIPNVKANVKDLVNQFARSSGEFVIGGSPAGVGSAGVATAERFMDPTARETRELKSETVGLKGFYEAFNRYRSRVPGLSADLPPRLNRWAEPVEHGGGNWWEMVSPIRVKQGSQKEVDRIWMEVGLPLTMPSRFISFNDVRAELTPQQYNRMLTIYAQELTVNGEGVQEAIVKAATDPAFDRLDRAQQQTLLRSIDERYLEAARKMLLVEDVNLQINLERRRDRAGTFGLYSDEVRR
jgi:hypothetical protein